ncbi:hypothetical protein GQ53DRAFT_739337 [Thozetella sp. PMI_491]|nr:hypothetical protein GQ53DRAFT_739337 [Thozetella sp. PMI_491]
MAELEACYLPFEGISGHQGAQTLDQSYYDILCIEDLKIRDEDQVVYKWFPHEIECRCIPSATSTGVVHTHRCQRIHSTSLSDDDVEVPCKNLHSRTRSTWMLTDFQDITSVVEGTIVTTFPERWHIGHEDSLLDTVRQSGIRSFLSPEELMGHIIHECATFLDKFKYAGLGVHILDIFESCIATRNKDEPNTKDAKTIEEEAKSIDKEIKLIYEVKDIRDELHLILRVFENQRSVLENLSIILWPGTSDLQKNYREQFIQDCGIEALMKRTERLDTDAERMLNALDYLVQTKQAQSSLAEAELARRQNDFIMLFTIVTIIFVRLFPALLSHRPSPSLALKYTLSTLA